MTDELGTMMRKDVIYPSSPELQEINKQINLSNDAIVSLFGKEKGREILDVMTQNKPGARSYLEQQVLGKLASLAQETQGGLKNTKALEDYVQAIKDAGLDATKAESMVKRMQDVSENYALHKIAEGTPLAAGRDINVARQMATKLANPAGYYLGQPVTKATSPGAVVGRSLVKTIEKAPQAGMVGTADDVNNQPAKTSRSLYDMPNNDLMETVQSRLGGNERYQSTIQRLQEAVESNNLQQKNAMLFKLLQDKDARNLLKGTEE
jgi:hypothetical protein